MLVHAYHPSTWEMEVGGSESQVILLMPVLHETLSPNLKKTNKYHMLRFTCVRDIPTGLGQVRLESLPSTTHPGHNGAHIPQHQESRSRRISIRPAWAT